MSLTWEDKEVRFDIPFSEMRLTFGEKIVDRLEGIEDTKGNGGDRGRMIITTLRILWHSATSPRVNLSIGYNTILNIKTKVINSKLRGSTQALHMLTHSANSRFEFIFTNLIPVNIRHFTSVLGVQKAYISSKLYRELKLRGAVVHNKELKILPQEQIFTTLHGVWNLSSEQGNLGTLIVTNVRIVWFADANECFNISLPYLKIETIKIRESKFGTTLVITTGSYILGFRIDPEERLTNVFRELASLLAIYTKNPIYGVEYHWTLPSQPKDDYSNSQFLLQELNEVEEPKGEMTNILSTYLADEGHAKDQSPVYCDELGLAVERVKSEYSLQKLWEVIPL